MFKKTLVHKNIKQYLFQEHKTDPVLVNKNLIKL